MQEGAAAMHNPEFSILLNTTAEFLGFGNAAEMKSRLTELGALEELDWFLIHDLCSLTSSSDAEAVALLILLLRSRNQGSLCLPLYNIEEQLKNIHAPTSNADKIHAWIKTNPTTLIAEAPKSNAPLVYDKNENLLYIQQLFRAETAIFEKISALASHKPASFSTEKINSIFKEVFIERPFTIQGKRVTLNAEQKTACLLGLINPLTLITGGPGTGKTSMIAALLRCLILNEEKPEAIFLTAPTGRAARRMSNSIRLLMEDVPNPTDNEKRITEIRSGTVHKLLSCNPQTGEFQHTQEQPVPCSFLILDEASMLSAQLMHALLDALPLSCRIVLIGDKNQLPSVDTGAVLRDLLPEAPCYSAELLQLAQDTLKLQLESSRGKRLTDKTVFLKTSYRSERYILNFAKSVNKGEPVADSNGNAVWYEAGAAHQGLPAVPTGPEGVIWPARIFKNGSVIIDGGGCWKMPPFSSPQEFAKLMISWISNRMERPEDPEEASWTELLQRAVQFSRESPEFHTTVKKIFQLLNSARILTVLRQGPSGCNRINSILAEEMKRKTDSNRKGALFHGLPLMITKNDAQSGLYNGDVGIILKIRETDGRIAYRACFEQMHRTALFDLDRIPEYEPAFAITVHKSQGSEYNEVLLILPNEPEHSLNTREIIYTGITRARHLAVIYGSDAVLQTGIANRGRRSSGLNHRKMN